MKQVKRVAGRLSHMARRFKSLPLRAEYETVRDSERLEFGYGDIFHLGIKVTNRGENTWDSNRPDHPDYLSYHWVGPGGDILGRDGLRTSLPGIVPPGGSAVVPLRVSVDVPVDEARLAVDMVREGETWFTAAGGRPLSVPCRIDLAVVPGPASAGGSKGPSGQVKSPQATSVEQLWGERAEVRAGGEEMGWLDHKTVLEECVFPKLGVGEEGNWLLALLRRHEVRPGGHWLSLGCGDGGFELWLNEKGAAGSLEGVDISPQAVDVANRTAKERGVENVYFRVLDLNREGLTPGSYDVIVASMAIHHIEELEKAFDDIYGALRPGGFLLASEYVGPSRFQFPRQQVELAERIIAFLPKELRYNRFASKEQGRVIYKDRYQVRTPEHWMEIDPSEAVRSEEIIPLFKERFDRGWVYPYGGNVLHLVLENIVANFDPEDERDRGIIKMMDLLESELLKNGSLESDFAVFVGRR